MKYLDNVERQPSQHGWAEVPIWNTSSGTRRIALDGEHWYRVLHGPVIVTLDKTAKEEDTMKMEMRGRPTRSKGSSS